MDLNPGNVVGSSKIHGAMSLHGTAGSAGTVGAVAVPVVGRYRISKPIYRVVRSEHAFPQDSIPRVMAVCSSQDESAASFGRGIVGESRVQCDCPVDVDSGALRTPGTISRKCRDVGQKSVQHPRHPLRRGLRCSGPHGSGQRRQCGQWVPHASCAGGCRQKFTLPASDARIPYHSTLCQEALLRACVVQNRCRAKQAPRKITHGARRREQRASRA